MMSRRRLLWCLLLLPPVNDLVAQVDSTALRLDSLVIAVGDDSQPAHLPPLPPGMHLADIVAGDSVFHGKGHCFACHGAEAQGLPEAGNGITRGITDRPVVWASLDSLITAGIPNAQTISPISMPPRGGRSDLTPSEVAAVAAYVWAITQTRGEPWPGGHRSHWRMIPVGATKGTGGTYGVLGKPGVVPGLEVGGSSEPKVPAVVVLAWGAGVAGLVLVVWLNWLAFKRWVVQRK